MTRLYDKRIIPGGRNSVRTTGISGDSANSDDYILVPVTLNPNQSDWTLDLFINPIGDGSYYNMQLYSQLDGDVGNTGRSWGTIALVGNHYSSFFGGITRNSSVAPMLDIWQRFIYTYSQAQKRLKYYFASFNNDMALVGDFSSMIIEDANGNHVIAASKGFSRCLDGYNGEYRLFSRTLELDEIQSLHSRADFDSTNLEVEYLYTDDSGDTITDSSGNGNHGTLMNGAAINTSVVPYEKRSYSTRNYSTRTF